MKEIWKDINGYKNLYQISNKGNIKSLGFYRYSFKNKKKEYIKREKILSPTNDRGYLKIKLSKNGNKKIKYIHRLVAENFIKNPKKYKEVNHKDNNPRNNCVDNLEWCDREYNINYMVKHQNKIKERHELRIEILENIYYGIESGEIKNLKEVKERIDINLLNEY